jgi:Kef-type K+ transport system membrane component KefB
MKQVSTIAVMVQVGIVVALGETSVLALGAGVPHPAVDMLLNGSIMITRSFAVALRILPKSDSCSESRCCHMVDAC